MPKKEEKNLFFETNMHEALYRAGLVEGGTVYELKKKGHFKGTSLKTLIEEGFAVVVRPPEKGIEPNEIKIQETETEVTEKETTGKTGQALLDAILGQRLVKAKPKRKGGEKARKKGEKEEFRGSFTELLKITPEELRLIDEKSLNQPQNRRMHGVEVFHVTHRVGGYEITLPAESIADSSVKNSVGVPIAEQGVCKCGNGARKGKTICRKCETAFLVKKQEWLDQGWIVETPDNKRVLGPVTQQMAGIYQFQAEGIDQSIWRQMQTEGRNAALRVKKETNRIKAIDRLNNYVAWIGRLLAEDRTVAEISSFNDAVELLTWIAEEIEADVNPFYLQKDFSEVVELLKTAQRAKGIHIPPPKNKERIKIVPKRIGNRGRRRNERVRARKGAAGVGANAKIRARWSNRVAKESDDWDKRLSGVTLSTSVTAKKDGNGDSKKTSGDKPMKSANDVLGFLNELEVNATENPPSDSHIGCAQPAIEAYSEQPVACN